MSKAVNRIVFFMLMLLVVVSPLPLGSNREWSWSLCALIAGILGLLWLLANARQAGSELSRLPTFIPLLFLFSCVWMVVQMGAWTPVNWHHPLWLMVSEALGIELSSGITLSTDDGWTALMRLLSYTLVFILTFHLCRDRVRARFAIGCLAIAGLLYAVFALYVYWSGYYPEWLFRGRVLQYDVRGTFINRNHFATWQGLTMLCTIAWFYQFMSRPKVMPYQVPQEKDDQVEGFILKAWKPLIAVLLMVTALLLTHSRGGFTSAMVGVIVLLTLLDRRASSHKGSSRVIVIAALAVAGIAFYLTSQGVLDRINATDISSEERTAVFADINRGITDNPILGYGYGTFADSFRLYDDNEAPVHYDRGHNTWLENTFELGMPAALALFGSIIGLTLVCLRGIRRRHRDWVYPATGVAASVLVGLHALVDFSLQLPAVAIMYACIMGIAVGQSYSSVLEQ